MMPFVSIIVTSFLEQSRPYLDLCIESIKNIDYPKDRLEVIIVSPKNYEPLYDGCLTVHPTKDPYHNSHALNFGALCSKAESEYYFMVNDDTIVTKNSLKNLVLSSQSFGDFGITMPIGNDQQFKYYLPVPYINNGPYRIDQLKGHEQTLMNAESYYNQGLLFFETLCLYAVLIPKNVFMHVGLFDEARSGQDDIDFTKRICSLGFYNVVAMSSLVYHAGGVTSDITLGPLDSEARKQSLKSFDEKWGENA